MFKKISLALLIGSLIVSIGVAPDVAQAKTTLPSWDMDGFWWLDDDASGLNIEDNTGHGITDEPQETHITGVVKDTIIRLRIDISETANQNQGVTVAPRIEYQTGDAACTAGGAWTTITTSLANAWALADSATITDGDIVDVNRVAGQIKPFGTGAGQFLDLSNPASAISYANASNEWEFSIKATSNASDNQIYTFRITNAGSVLNAYSLPTADDCPNATTAAANNPPTLTVTQPDGTGDTVTVGDLYNITYDLSDAEEVVTAAMYYDTDAVGLNGTAITGACATAAEGAGATCSWDTTGMTPGNYYVYGITNDGVNPAVNDYSPGVITINAPAKTLTISASVGSKVANVDSGATSQFVHNTSCTTDGTCSAFKLVAGGGDVLVTSITVTESSASLNADAELSNATLIYDTDANYSNGTTGTFGTDATFTSQAVTFTNAGLSITSGSTYYFYIRTDFVNGANNPTGGSTVNFQIANTTDVVSDGTESGTATLAGTTTIRPNVTDVTNSPLVDGGRNGETFTITGTGFGSSCASLSVVVGGLTLTCNSAATTTISATIPATQTTTYGGASSMLVTVGGTEDDASQTYYVYPSVNLVSTPLVSNAARELDNITLTNSTANASRFGATEGTVTFTGGFSSVGATVVSWGDTSIEVTVPAGIVDNIYTGDITVTRNADSKTDLAYDSDGFRILPRITLLTPNSGPNGQSTTIDGDHLCQPSGTCQSAATFNGTADDGNDVEWGTTDAVVTGTPTNTQIIANAPTLSDGGYQVTVTSGGGTSYTSNELTFTIANNASPTLSISAPPGGSTTIAEGSTYNVTYTLGDTDNVVTAAFYYDTNGDGVGGVAITGCGTKAEGAGATCSFDTSVLSVSTPYYVYGVTTDGVNPTVTTVSSGTITVSDAPTLSISAPPGGNTAVAESSSYNVTYTLGDTDNIVTAAFYYDTNGDGVGGVAITGCGTKAEGTGATCSFDTSVLSVSTPYYVYGVTTDGVNPTVTTVSSGTITVNDAPTITVSQPDGTGDTVNAGDLYNITYTLADTDNIVTTAMYYDTDAAGLNGTAITGACATAAEGTGATCSWDTTGMSPGTYYVYGRGVNDGVNAEVSDYSPGMITINAPPQVVASSVGTQTANFDSGVTGQYVGAAWTFRQTTGSADTITALTLSDVGGSANANIDLSNAFLRYEQPGASTCTYNGTETSTGTVGFNASDQAVFSGLTIPVTLHATNVTCVYLIFDFKNGTDYPAGGQTFEPEITSSANFTLQNSTAKAGTYPVTLSGATTVRPNVTDVTNSPLVDGGRNGETFTITGTGFGSSCASLSVVVGGLTLTCNSAATTTISATIPSTQTTTYGGASSMLVTVGGTEDDASQTYFVYPSVNLVSTPLVSNAARELDNITLTNSTANASRFGATEGTVTFTGGFGSVGATVVSWGDTSIEVTVPSAIGDTVYLGDITVTRNADSKTDTAYGSNGFRILPKITSLDPASASVGDAIIVNGNHFCQSGTCPVAFGANDKVTFESLVDATFWNTWSNTVIQTKVPTSAVTGDVIVTSDTYTSNGSTFTLASATPDEPTDLGQFKDAGFAQAIAIEGTASSTPIYLKMTMSAALSGGILYPQFEYKPIGTSFACGAGACGTASEGTGSAGPGPATGSKSVSPTDEVYHWQARVKHIRNAVDYYSAWVPFGGNGENETDFKIDTTAPVITSTSSGSPGTNGATITWSTSGEISTSRVEYDTAGTFTGGYDCAGTSECTTLADTSPMVNSHSVTLSNLNSGATYHYRVRSKDAAGNEKIDPTSGDYTFVTQAENHPAKTTNTFIDGAEGIISGATTYYFKVDAPETTPPGPDVKSAYVEVVGVVSGGTGTVTVAVNGSSRAYDVSAANPTLYRFMYPIASPNTETNLNLNDVAPCSNAVVPGTPPQCNKVVLTPATVSVNVLSAKIITTYSYTP